MENEETMRIHLKASKASYRQTPIWVAISGRPPREPFRVQGGAHNLPAQVVEREGKRWMVWIEPDLPQNQARVYQVRPASSEVGFSINQTESAVRVMYRGQPFTAYVFRGAPKPYLYPLMGPTGKPITRHFPMQRISGESMDHPHHRSVWFTHGEVNGIDFWAEGANKGRVEHRELLVAEAGPVLARIVAQNDWVAPDGKKVCEETTEIVCYATPDARFLDYTVTLTASEGEVRLGDTKEGSFGIRVASSMEVTRNQGGQIVNSAGQRDRDAWGKRAQWCDYTGIVEGEVVGIAIFDHPSNLRHPTYWHVRDYGLFAVNPFGVHDFVPGTRKGEGDHTIPAGKSLTLRYRVWLHKGRTEEAGVDAQYRAYANPPEAMVR